MLNKESAPILFNVRPNSSITLLQMKREKRRQGYGVHKVDSHLVVVMVAGSLMILLPLHKRPFQVSCFFTYPAPLTVFSFFSLSKNQKKNNFLWLAKPELQVPGFLTICEENFMLKRQLTVIEQCIKDKVLHFTVLLF
jgi:hypothetical protein